MIGRITSGVAYRKEGYNLVSWCEDENLNMDTDRTKERIADMERRPHRFHSVYMRLLNTFPLFFVISIR